MSTHFDEGPDGEFRCHCGRAECDAPTAPSRLLILFLERMRAMYDAPIRVTRGNTCRAHNDDLVPPEQLGKPDEHVQKHGCLGADLECETSPERLELVKAATDAGIVRIGLGPKHIHVGVGLGPDFVQGVLWLETHPGA